MKDSHQAYKSNIIYSELLNIIENVSQMVWKSDRYGNVMYSNEHWKTYVGPHGNNIFNMEATHPDDKDAVQQSWKDLLQNLKPINIQRRLKDAVTGRYNQFITKVVPILNSQGQLDYIIGTSTNIELEKEKWWSLLADKMDIILLTLDKNGYLVSVNKKFVDVTGVELQPHSIQLTSPNNLTWIHPDDRILLANMWYAVVTRISKDNLPLNIHFRIFDKKTSKYEWYLLNAHYIPSHNDNIADMSDNDIVWVAVNVNIDESQQSANEAKMRLEFIKKILPIIILATDVQGTVLFNVKSNIFDDKIPSSQLPISNENILDKVLSSPQENKIFQDVIALKKKDVMRKKIGDSYFQITIIPMISYEGTVIGTMSLWMDITETERLSRERDESAMREKYAVESSEMKMLFLANISHEFRTPLQGIEGMIELLMETELNQEQIEYLNTTKSSTDLMVKLVDDILDIARTENQHLKLRNMPFDLHKIEQEVIDSLKRSISAKGLVVSIVHDSNLPKILWGDPYRVKQILNNLISNSIKFTDHGYIKVHDAVISRDPVTRSIKVKIMVEDTGIGMTKEFLTKLRKFKPFTQADQSSTHKQGGTGLGIYITKMLVDIMHGEMTIDSVYNQGTVVSVIIQLGDGQREDDETTSQTYVSDEPPTPKELQFISGATILLAEDNAIASLVVERMLKKYHINVIIARNGLEAVEYFHENVDLVLMDIQMPIMDGYTAAKAIREKNPSVPIVAMTGNAMEEDIEISNFAGLNGHLTKPFSSEQLINVIINNINKTNHSIH